MGTEDIPREIKIILQPPATVLSGLSSFASRPKSIVSDCGQGILGEVRSPGVQLGARAGSANS